jgi:hypothetical protein
MHALTDLQIIKSCVAPCLQRYLTTSRCPFSQAVYREVLHDYLKGLISIYICKYGIYLVRMYICIHYVCMYLCMYPRYHEHEYEKARSYRHIYVCHLVSMCIQWQMP